jgi:hypothetical protein
MASRKHVLLKESEVKMPFTASSEDAIKARALNLTLFSGLAAGIATAITVFNKSFTAIFGDKLHGVDLANAKLTLVVAVIAAFALISVADLLARAWATSAGGSFVIASAPSGLSATKTTGRDETGFIVAAVRFKPSDPDAVEYLLVKKGEAPGWTAGSELTLS